jgi:lipopolysaccharide export LptBFGC system permease protein LptF
MRVMEVQRILKLSEIFERRDADTSRAKYRTSGTLLEDLAAGELPVDKERRYRFELHRRLALGATFLMFLLVGVPTGLWLRSGGQLSGLGAASLYAFGYYVLSLQLGKGLAYSGQLSAELAAWLAVGLGTLLGAVLTWRWTLR